MTIAMSMTNKENVLFGILGNGIQDHGGANV